MVRSFNIALLILFITSCGSGWDLASNNKQVINKKRPLSIKSKFRIDGIYYCYDSVNNKYGGRLIFWEDGTYFRGGGHNYDSIYFFSKKQIELSDSDKKYPSSWGYYHADGDSLTTHVFESVYYYTRLYEQRFKILNDSTIIWYLFISNDREVKTENIYHFRKLDWKPDSIDIIKGYHGN